MNSPDQMGKTDRAGTVLWVMWCAFAACLVFYRLMLVGPRADTHSIRAPDSAFEWVCYIIPIVVVMSLRWLLIPQLQVSAAVVAPFVVGCAAAEALTFFGIFLFPKQFTLYFLTSWLLLFQLMPLWKKQPSNPN